MIAWVNYLKRATGFLLLGSVMSFASANEEIVVWDRLADNPVAYKILELALDKTADSYGAYHLVASTKMEQGRAVVQLKANRAIDIASFAPNKAREESLLPIRIPVTQGLLGYRVCLIKKGTQKKFNGIKTLNNFKGKGLTIGQGKGWPDTEVLEANGLTVIKSAKYKTLFNMLERQRFDCFSRSISEVKPELEQYSELALEESLLFVYRLPTFFFVSQSNTELAKRVEKGLQLAYQDGSISNLIHANYKTLFKALNISQRTLIDLENPFLSDKTKVAFNSFEHWLDIKDY